MSKKKRANEALKKQNTPAKKAKRAKKEYYKTQAAKDAWEKKKRQRSEKPFNRPDGCSLPYYVVPGGFWCGLIDCKLNCPFAKKH